jgi:hypothetical protein
MIISRRAFTGGAASLAAMRLVNIAGQACIPAPGSIENICLFGNPSISKIALTPAQCALAVDPVGDFEISIRIIPNFGLVGSGNFTFFQAFDSNGAEYSLKFIAGTSGSNQETFTYLLTIQGNPIAVTVPGGTMYWADQFAAGQELVVHAWFKPYLAMQPGVTLDTAGLRVDVMGDQKDGFSVEQGSVNYVMQPATGSPLPPIVSCTIGSNSDGSGAMNASVSEVAFWPTGYSYKTSLNPAYLLIGDSMLTSCISLPPILSQHRSIPGYRSLGTVLDYAHPGAITNTMAHYLSEMVRIPAPMRAIIDNVGINDIVGGVPFSSIMIDKAALMAQARAIWPGVPYVMLLMPPCLGLIAGNPAAQAVWQQINSPSGLPSLGADKIVSGYIAVNGDNPSWSSGNTCPNLQAQYQALDSISPNVYDLLHENLAGRYNKETSILNEALIPLGVWQG